MKKCNVAIMGLGTVGGGTYDILVANREKIASCYDVDVEVSVILDKYIERATARCKGMTKVTDKLDDILSDKNIDIVVEVMGGVEPAKTFITKALTSGKSVVTANKELISKHWGELEAVAKAHKVGLYFEASCVGGVPIIRALNDSMQANNLLEIMGIINGTTNYILTKMTENNMSYADALKEAQELGYAEANPSADVDGYDAQYKLSILSSLAFNKCIPYTNIYREGISSITANDIASAKELGYTIKLLAIGKANGDIIEARVHPTFVPIDHPLASVSNAFNAVFLKGDFVDDIMLYGRGAGAYPTGSAIVSDIVYCMTSGKHTYAHFENNGELSSSTKIENNFESKYYLAITAMDKAGVLAKITSILAKYHVSINTIMQRGVTSDSFAHVVMLTHITQEKDMQNAIIEMEALAEVKRVDSLIRVI